MARGRRRNERIEPTFEDRPRRETRRAPPRRGRPRRRRSLFGELVRVTMRLALAGLIAVGAVIAWYAAALPPVADLSVPKRPPNVEIRAGDGSILANRGAMGGAAVSIRELPPWVPAAFVAIEDRRFYQHVGIDPVGLARAMAVNLAAGRLEQGGSTLTQQLAKNLFLTPERSLERKVQEAILAVSLEHRLSKDEILELYLNRVYFGGGAYGIEAAARRFFDKHARDLTLAEAALLAGLVKAPSALAPTRNPERAQERARLVLAAMVETGMIKERDMLAALADPAAPVSGTSGSAVNYVADWAMDVLDDYVGTLDGDIIVETTIDPAVQAAAEAALRRALDAEGEKLRVRQGAVVSLRPDGSVAALVGGRDYAKSPFNRAVSARRQPGSAFKPFVYLAAIEQGLTPDTIRDDAPISVRGWSPENFSRRYEGPVTLTQALAQSLNTVAVRLCLEVGPKAVVATAQRLGIFSPLAPNASLALGTSEVTPIELTAGYAAFANGGRMITPYLVTEIRAADGAVLFARREPPSPPVIDPAAVGMMNAMLRETLTVGTGRKAELPGWDAAGKTGTSQDFRDAWFVGYTARLVTGVWLGNDNNAPTRKASGSGLPVAIWSEVMQRAHEGVPVAALPSLPPASWQTAMLPPADVDSAPAGDGQRPRGLGEWIASILGRH